MNDNGNSIWQQAWNALAGLLNNNQKDLLTILRTPTPVKISKVLTVDSSGCIGGGLDTPDPVELYRCPMSHEAWLNRITITSPEHHPTTPLTTGEAYIIGSTSGEIILFLPINGNVAPVQAPEGRLSAPHLNPGEVVAVVGDQLPVGNHLRFDFQIMLVTGISEYTPKTFAPDIIQTDEEVVA
jgi:hypothetical protein